MLDMINGLYGLTLIMVGICSVGAVALVGYIMGFRTCEKSYKELFSAFEEELEDELNYEKRKEL